MEHWSQNQSWAQQLRRGLVTLEQLEERGWLDSFANNDDLQIAKSALDIRVPVVFHDEIQQGRFESHQSIYSLCA